MRDREIERERERKDKKEKEKEIEMHMRTVTVRGGIRRNGKKVLKISIIVLRLHPCDPSVCTLREYQRHSL